ncbi:MAG: DUF3560 domain-containing protein [Gammaproteobacteria bacterium]|nr:DUF3560 domain-containing protein [Gammaproteobacteria bacterium]
MMAIYSDDPTAVQQLEEKLQKMEKERDDMKLINKQYKKAVKRGEVDKSGSVADYLGAFLAEAGKEVKPETCVKLVECVEKGYSWEKAPYPSYTMTNLGANIRTVKKRIEKLKVVATEETSEYTSNGVRVLDNCEDHRLQMFFDGKPEQAIRTELKRSGFRWSPTNECWQSYRGTHQNRRAKAILLMIPVPVTA